MRHHTATSGGRAAIALAAGVVVASCIAQNESTETSARREPASKKARAIENGDYSCRIESGGYQYRPFRCAVYRAEDGSQVLEKLGGSQRFRGRVMMAERGFSFDGTFYCPAGDCTEGVTGQFRSVGAAGYEGTMQGRSGPLGVTLQYLPGGYTYGGRVDDTMEGAPPPMQGAARAPAE